MNLRNNQLKNLSKNVFNGLDSCLISLKLEMNKLEFIKSFYFKRLNSLKFIDLSSNSISSIDLTSFDGLYNLIELNLSN
ncbi:MAG: hypothetical protein ACIWVG_08195, partial [Gloeotrichia echinulata HAB0833]